jgi:1,4-dihydroxy-2-naphthoate octaprenyltransferase
MPGIEHMPEITFQWHILWLALTGLLAPAAFILGRVHKRRRAEPLTMRQQLKNLAVASVILGLLLMLAARFS